MAQPYIGEIRIFAGNFAPAGWLFCDGSILPISENEALFQLIGTTYGGDGQETFRLPDLRGRLPVSLGTGPSGTTRFIGETTGTETVTLTTAQIPAHTHFVGASTGPGHRAEPEGAVLAAHRDRAAFGTAPAPGTMAAGAVQPAGGSQPHENMPPFLCVSYIISLFGIFPSQF